MEVQSSFELPFPSDECFEALRGEVLPRLNVTYRLGYPLIKIPAGRIKMKVVESHERAAFLKAKMQLAPYTGIPYTFGPVVHIACVRSSSQRCTVELSSEATMWDGAFLNFVADVTKKAVPHWLAKSYPRVYFGDTVVYDERTFKSDSHREDANVRALKYLFAQVGEQLRAQLQRTIPAQT